MRPINTIRLAVEALARGELELAFGMITRLTPHDRMQFDARFEAWASEGQKAPGEDVDTAIASFLSLNPDLPPTREAMAGMGLPFSNTDFESFHRAMDQAVTLAPEVGKAWSEKLLARHSWTNVARRVVNALGEVS